MISHVPSGVVSDKYGAKHVIETSLVLTSVCLIFTPVLVHTVERNAIGLYLVTLVTGVAQGLTVPAMASFLAHWAPARERGTLVCIALGGLFSGTIINNLVTESMIIACDNWSVPFYVYGGMGLGLLLIWHLIVYSNPHLDPHITSKERLYLDIQMSEWTVPIGRFFMRVFRRNCRPQEQDNTCLSDFHVFTRLVFVDGYIGCPVVLDFHCGQSAPIYERRVEVPH
jgi:MFS family permease